MKRVFITGVMGSGKSSIAAKVTAKLRGSLFSEKINDKIVSSTFNNKDTSLALLSQTSFLMDILGSLQNDEIALGEYTVYDTSLYTNEFFAEYLLNGDYQTEYNTLSSVVKSIVCSEDDINVVLFCSYSTMLERIKSRGRKFELDNKFDYDAYYSSFQSNIVKLFEIHNNDKHFIFVDVNYRSPNDIANEIVGKIKVINE